MYILQDSPLVLHMLTSCWPTSQPVTSPHASAEVRFSSDSNGQSPGHQMNAVLLCQQPGFPLAVTAIYQKGIRIS